MDTFDLKVLEDYVSLVVEVNQSHLPFGGGYITEFWLVDLSRNEKYLPRKAPVSSPCPSAFLWLDDEVYKSRAVTRQQGKQVPERPPGAELALLAC